MNDRIKELAISCGWYDNPFGDICVESDFAEKFAELIIKECIKVVYDNVEVALDATGNVVFEDELLKKYFGIEE